jgi:glycosyltransferase involved in cell wall biosynthesis
MRPLSAIANRSYAPDSARPCRQPLIYVLHSSNMYGTERMALATAQGLADDFETIFLGPRGPALSQAAELGFETESFQTIPALVKLIGRILRRFRCLTFVSTLPCYSGICMGLNLVFGRNIRYIQMIHGGGNEKKDYSRLRRFNPFEMTFVTVSHYTQARLVEFGVRADRIAVVGNFLTREQLAQMPPRPQYQRDGIRQVVMVSRIDPTKRLDLLLDALDRVGPELRDVTFRVFGWGPDIEKLRARADATHPNVEFAGYISNVASQLADADLFLHTCPVEAFGLAVLEAMAVGLVPLVPDQGGAAALVNDGVTGFTFRAGDVEHLAARLIELKNAPANLLNRIAAGAQHQHESHFSAEASLGKYRQLFVPRRLAV